MGFTPFVTEARSLLYLRSREVLLHALLHGAGFPLFLVPIDAARGWWPCFETSTGATGAAERWVI